MGCFEVIDVNRELALLITAGALLAVSAAGVAAIPGAMDAPTHEEPPPGAVGVTEQVVSPGEVTGQTAELTLRTDLDHHRGPVENLSVRYRAIDSRSGLLEAEETVTVGDVDADGEFSVNGSLVVPRSDGYVLETTVYAGNDRVAQTTTNVEGVHALTPAYADQHVGFADSTLWPTVAVSVVAADDDTATLRIATSVTNDGDDRSEDLRLGVLLRQSESNVVADRAETTVESIRPGRTATVSITVDVPAEYNYYVDAALWHDDVLVDETQSVANLDPQETIDANETKEDVEFSVGDFSEESDDDPTRAEADDADRREAPVEDETPGFGFVAAIAAIVGVALAARRRR